MRTNLKMIAAASAFAIAAVAQPAAAADFFPNTEGASPDGNGEFSFSVTGDPFNGPVSGGIERTGLEEGTFTDRFLFTLGQDGLGSGSITTSLAGSIGGNTDVDFLSATFFNGVTSFVVPLSGVGALEMGGLVNIPISAGVQNILTINFRSRGQGSYGGNLSFTPTAAIPEPETWALMLLGFAGIGMVMRRRRKDQVRVKYAF